MWECNSLLKTPHSALQLHWDIKGFVLKSIYHYVSKSFITCAPFFFSSAYWKDMNKEFKLHVLTVKGIPTQSNSTSALPGCFPLRITTKLMQNRKATVRLSRTTWLPMSLAALSARAWLGKASMEVQKASSCVLFQQAHSWMADENSNDYKSHKDTQVVYSTDLAHTI